MIESRPKSIGEQWQADPAQAWQPLPLPWQRYAADLHQRLLEHWRGVLPAGTPILKTDLFEEALGEDHPAARMTQMGWRVLGMDLGRRIARRAMRNRSAGFSVNADARALPFRSNSMPAIFSNSTLDHFENKSDLIRSLGELYRILRPGGRLILTLDNAQCPIVALRNALPRRFTDRAGITRFYVGHTLTLSRMKKELEALGFEIRATGTFMHAIRWIALPLLRVAACRSQTRGLTESILLRLECLQKLPTARLTGHFVFVEAVKPPVGSKP